MDGLGERKSRSKSSPACPIKIWQNMLQREWSDGEEQRWEIRGASVTLLEKSQKGTTCKEEGEEIAMGK